MLEILFVYRWVDTVTCNDDDAHVLLKVRFTISKTSVLSTYVYGLPIVKNGTKNLFSSFADD